MQRSINIRDDDKQISLYWGIIGGSRTYAGLSIINNSNGDESEVPITLSDVGDLIDALQYYRDFYNKFSELKESNK